MNRLKLTLIIVGTFAALVALAVVLALTSGVQTWAVRRALAGQPSLKGEVGSVSAGLRSAELRDVHLQQGGVVFVAKEINATYSVSDYLFGHRINVGRVTVRGLEIDARNPAAKSETPPAAAALAPFAGILGAVRLPGEVRLASLDVEAKVLLPDNQSATLTVEGGGIAPGEFARFGWKATFADPRKNAPLSAVQAAGELKLRTTADLRIDSVELTGDVGATGPSLPADRIKLELKLAQPTAGAGETIAARVALMRGTAVEPLFDTQAAYAAGKPELSGSWNLTVRSEQFAAVLASLGLPEAALTGAGRFTYNVDTGAATALGAFDGKVSKLEKLGAELAAIGSLQVHAAFDGGSSKESAELNKLEFAVATDNGRKLISGAVQQKLSFAFKTKRLTPEHPGTELARVSLLGLPLAWAQPFVKPRVIAGGDVSGAFVVEAELDGSRIKLTALEPLTIRDATLREGEKTLVDRMTLSVSPQVDYTAARIVAGADKLSVSTPDGDTVTGSLSAEITSGAKPATAFSVQLQGRLAALVKPYLPADAGPLALSVNAKGRLEGSTLQVAALKVQIDREGNGLLAAVEVAQPLTVELNTQKVRAPDAAAVAARVRWGDIPLAWAEPYVAQSKFAGQLVTGAIDVTLPGDDAVVVRALDKLSIHGATVVLNGQELLRAADFVTDLNATWKSGTLTADVHQLVLRQGEVTLLTAAVAGDVTPGKTLRATGRGSLSADFAALAKQPALAAQLPLLRGTVNVKFDGTLADSTRGKIEIAAQNLVAREGAQPLGSMELSVDAALDVNRAGTVRNSLVVTKDGRRSDLLLDGKVGLKPGAISFEGRITGEQLFLDDLQAFSALSAPPPPSAIVAKTSMPSTPRPAAGGPAARPAGPVKDITPVWAGFTGRADLNIKTIKQGEGNTLQDLRGVVSVREDRLAVESLSLQLNGNPVKAATILSFDVKQPRPYTLAGTFDVPGFNVGEYLRKADPSTPPVVETTVTITSKFNGSAANLPEFADRLTGQFDLKGSKGILRALNKKAEATSTVTGLLGLAAGLAGQQRIAEGLASASQLASLLKDIPFDGISIQVERGSDTAIAVKSIEVLSPSMHLTGSGRIDHKPGVQFGLAPLTLELQLAAKGELANGLKNARQLSGNTDAKGYYLMATPFTLGGTVSKPDSSAFWKNLTLNTGAGFLR